MRALQLTQVGQIPEVVSVPAPVAGKGSAIVNVSFAAVNRRDYYIYKGLYPRIKVPVILGSDASGFKDDKLVVINPGLNWASNASVQPPDFEVLGMPKNGTFAEQVLVPSDNVQEVGNHLSSEEWAALPLPGMTAYRAVFTKGNLQSGELVLITGAGGGVATMAILFAIASGARVVVTSGSDEKIQRCIELGAVGGERYDKEGWAARLKSEYGAFNLVIDSAGGPEFHELTNLVAPGGKLVFYGASLGKWINVNPQMLFWRQVSILGTTMASGEEFRDMIRFVHDHEIHPVVDSVYALSDFESVLSKMQKNSQFGNIVIDVHR